MVGNRGRGEGEVDAVLELGEPLGPVREGPGAQLLPDAQPGGKGVGDRPGEEELVVVQLLVELEDTDGRLLVGGDVRAADEGLAIARRVVKEKEVKPPFPPG